jgi:nucleoside 2-deoxyribosyltransferase
MIYLAGPIRGMNDYNEAEFRRAAVNLRARGYEVVSPLELDRQEDGNIGGKPRRYYLRRDIMRLLQCTQVAVLEGWELSEGAALEAAVARAVRMPVVDAMSLEEVDNPLTVTVLGRTYNVLPVYTEGEE